MAESQAISVRVENPRTHIRNSWRDHCYTDYEITLVTENIAFAKQKSKVRRSYSDFAWLDSRLSEYGSITIKRPVFPGNKLFGRFKPQFLKKRSQDLQQYLESVLQITPFLSDVALHLFLQTALAVKEMDRVLSGKDNREISEIIIPDHKPCQREREGRKSSAFRDSGYSGSLHDGTPDVELEDSGWTPVYINHANGQILGNGWSSGCTCASQASPIDCKTRASPPSKARRMSPPTRTAAVLPGGQLVLPSEGTKNDRVERWLDSASALQQDDDDDQDFDVIYDADNETDPFQSDYDVISENRRLRVREWLKSTCDEDYDDCDSSDVEAESYPNGLRLLEYDVISVPCLRAGLVPRCRTPHSVAHASDGDSDSEESFANVDDCDEMDTRSCFSVLHSSIDGLDFQDRDELSASCESSSSLKVFNTYDVVEMIELKYILYHLV